jgi:hypothetical protein
MVMVVSSGDGRQVASPLIDRLGFPNWIDRCLDCGSSVRPSRRSDRASEPVCMTHDHARCEMKIA